MTARKLSYDQRVARISANLCTSFWLRDALVALHKRDPLDALNDARQLAEVACQRYNEAIYAANAQVYTLPIAATDATKPGATANIGDIGHAEVGVSSPVVHHEDPAAIARWEEACRR